MKKAQIELVGLVFIVLILTIIMLFYVSYSFQDEINPQKTELKKYSDSELSVSFVDVLLHTSVCGVTVKDLMIDCAKYNKIKCDSGSKTSCQKLNETITEIKEKTLDKWGYSYGFLINIEEDKEFVIYSNYTSDCVPGEVIIGKSFPGLFYLGLNPNNLRIELGLCT